MEEALVKLLEDIVKSKDSFSDPFVYEAIATIDDNFSRNAVINSFIERAADFGVKKTFVRKQMKDTLKKVAAATMDTGAGAPSDDGYPTNLSQFHRFKLNEQTGQFEPVSVIHNNVFTWLRENSGMFVIGKSVYNYDGGSFKTSYDNVALKDSIRRLIFPDLVTASTIRAIADLFFMDKEISTNVDRVNLFPKEWICFKNGFYDVLHDTMIPHDPKYRCINQIPHEYHPGTVPEGANMDAWLDFAFPEADDREMFLQYVGYCMTRDTGFQKFLLLTGSGGNGKSVAINLLNHIVGLENIGSVPMEKLNERFQNYNLVGKLLNSVGDLKVAAIEDTEVLKQITGEGTITVEQKGVQGFEVELYCKMIFSINQLPVLKTDKSDAFWRRILILKMDRPPERINKNLTDELKAEIDRLIYLSVEALKRAYKDGCMIDSKRSAEARLIMRHKSDTVQAFLDDCCITIRDSKYPKDWVGAERTALYSLYRDYCRKEEREAAAANSFYESLRTKGFNPDRKSNGKRVVYGVKANLP